MFILLILAIMWKVQNKIKIKYKTFLYRGFVPKRGDFGVYTYDGKQGKGKTYSIVEYLIDNKDNIEIYGMDYNKGGQYAKMFKLEEEDKNYLINIFSRKNYKLKPFHPSLIGTSYTFCVVNTKNNEEMYFHTMGNYLIINNTIFYEKKKTKGHSQKFMIYIKNIAQKGPKDKE